MDKTNDDIFISLVSTFYNMLGGLSRFSVTLEYILGKAANCKWISMKNSIAFLLGYLAIKDGKSGYVTIDSLDSAFRELKTLAKYNPVITKVDIYRYARLWKLQLLKDSKPIEKGKGKEEVKEESIEEVDEKELAEREEYEEYEEESGTFFSPPPDEVDEYEEFYNTG